MVLIIILGGIVDVGRLLFYSVSLRDAAQEGVNYGAMVPSKTTATSDTSDIVSRAKTSLDASDPGLTVDVTFNGGAKQANAACAGDTIEVTVRQANFPFIMPVIGTFLGGNTITVTQSYSGTVLRPACP